MTTMIKQFIILGVIASTGLTACTSGGGIDTTGQKATIGTLAGAIGGAALGSRFGQGSGKVAAIAGGALLGGFLGNQIGARLDEEDKKYYYSAQYQALETGRAQRWSNPQSGVYGVSDAGAPYMVNNAQCREYTNTIYIDGRPEVARGTACRNPDGTWRPVD